MKEYYNDYRLNNQTEEIQLEAVKQFGPLIKYIFNPSEKVQLEAVKEDGDSIQYINNPSEDVQLEAVKNDGLSIQFIKNPSEKVQLEAVNDNKYSIQFIKDINNLINKYYNYEVYKYLEDLYYPFTEEFKKSYNYKKYLLEKNI